MEYQRDRQGRRTIIRYQIDKFATSDERLIRSYDLPSTITSDFIRAVFGLAADDYAGDCFHLDETSAPHFARFLAQPFDFTRYHYEVSCIAEPVVRSPGHKRHLIRRSRPTSI